MNQTNLDKAILDPASVFQRPEDVIHTPAFTRLERILVLRNWAYDARELEVAEEEGMGGSDESLLKPILDSLRCLVGDRDVEHPAPSKHHPLPD